MKAKLLYLRTDKTFQIKIKSCSWWWLLLLLLLLPLILLIKCSKEVNFKIVNESNSIQATTPLSFEYNFRQLFDFKTKKFNTFKSYKLEAKSGNDGMVKFVKVQYTIYQWLFYFNETSKVFAYNECQSSGVLKPLFRTLGKSPTLVTIKNKGLDTGVLVLDINSKEPLPNANVEVTWDGQNQGPMTSKTDATGIAFFKNPIPLCKTIKIKANCKGYYDTTVVYTKGIKLSSSQQTVEIKLRPEQVSLLILAKDAKTGSPISLVNITIKDKNGKIIDERTTNSGGKTGIIPGSVEFLNLPPTLYISICGIKESYKQKCIEGLVRDLRNGGIEKRTLLMEPGDGAIAFWVLDKNSQQPIAGANVQLSCNGNVKNGVTADDGSVTFAELSNECVISISASRNLYKTNDYTINNLNIASLKGSSKSARTIPLELIKEPEPIPPPPPQPPAQENDLQGQTGDLRVNLQWFSADDLDLYVKTPCGKQIYFLRKKADCNGSVGHLDVDANFLNEKVTSTPQENVFWTNPMQGTYTISVNHFKNRTGSMAPMPFNITIIYKGVRKDYSSSVSPSKKVVVTNFLAN